MRTLVAIRLSTISGMEDNYITFDESLSKTFRGGLNDLTKMPRYIKHLCHEVGEKYEPCVYAMYLKCI